MRDRTSTAAGSDRPAGETTMTTLTLTEARKLLNEKSNITFARYDARHDSAACEKMDERINEIDAEIKARGGRPVADIPESMRGMFN